MTEKERLQKAIERNISCRYAPSGECRVRKATEDELAAIKGGDCMSKCDWQISKAKRRMSDRRMMWRLNIFSRLLVGVAVVAVAAVSLG